MQFIKKTAAAAWTQVTRFVAQVKRVAAYPPVALLLALAGVIGTGLMVRRVILGWVCGSGWTTVERVIAVTGPEVAAGLVTVVVFTAAVAAVAAKGLLGKARRAVTGQPANR